MGCTMNSNQVAISTTEGHCPIGEITGNRNIANSKIPVISCEGACIRGEIARLAANIISRKEGFGRGCHGELITVPDSAIAKWIKAAEKVLLIDGCFLRCHGRILENLIAADKLVQFDALSFYKKYNDIFDVDDVPEAFDWCAYGLDFGFSNDPTALVEVVKKGDDLYFAYLEFFQAT